jgi:hypothetical protein
LQDRLDNPSGNGVTLWHGRLDWLSQLENHVAIFSIRPFMLKAGMCLSGLLGNSFCGRAWLDKITTL